MNFEDFPEDNEAFELLFDNPGDMSKIIGALKSEVHGLKESMSKKSPGHKSKTGGGGSNRNSSNLNIDARPMGSAGLSRTMEPINQGGNKFDYTMQSFGASPDF